MQNYEKKVTFQSKSPLGSVTIFSPFSGGKTATNALNMGIHVSYPQEKTVTMLKRFNIKTFLFLGFSSYLCLRKA